MAPSEKWHRQPATDPGGRRFTRRNGCRQCRDVWLAPWTLKGPELPDNPQRSRAGVRASDRGFLISSWTTISSYSGGPPKESRPARPVAGQSKPNRRLIDSVWGVRCGAILCGTSRSTLVEAVVPDLRRACLRTLGPAVVSGLAVRTRSNPVLADVIIRLRSNTIDQSTCWHRRSAPVTLSA